MNSHELARLAQAAETHAPKAFDPRFDTHHPRSLSKTL